jgi:hypothetical protein
MRASGPGILIPGIIKVDGHEVGRLKNGSYGIVRVTPGTHSIRYAKPAWSLELGAETTLNCEPGKSYFIIYRAQMIPTGTGFTNIGEFYSISEYEGTTIRNSLPRVFIYGEIK